MHYSVGCASKVRSSYWQYTQIQFFYEQYNKCIAGVSSLGVLEVPWHPQILAYQLTLSHPGGQIMPTKEYRHPQIFRPSYGPVRE
jgi:hypothetical protein